MSATPSYMLYVLVVVTMSAPGVATAPNPPDRLPKEVKQSVNTGLENQSKNDDCPVSLGQRGQKICLHSCKPKNTTLNGSKNAAFSG
eukprot:2710258-Amphidinium_carterae.1